MTRQSIYKSLEGKKQVMELYDEALERWPVPSEKVTVNTRHGETFIIASGEPNAPPLILLHGAGSNSAVWAPDASVYSKHFRFYTVDLPGEPGKSTENRPPWEGPAFSEWLEDVLDELKLDRTLVGGISQGAWTALRFATLHPTRVEKLILMSPGGIVPDKMSFFIRYMALTLLGEWGLRRSIASLFGKQKVPEGVEDIMLTITRHFNPRVGVLPIFSDEELANLTMKTLLLGGTLDPMRDMEKIAARLEQHLPELIVNTIPEAGHALLNTSPYVMDFLGDPKLVEAGSFAAA